MIIICGEKLLTNPEFVWEKSKNGGPGRTRTCGQGIMRPPKTRSALFPLRSTYAKRNDTVLRDPPRTFADDFERVVM